MFVGAVLSIFDIVIVPYLFKFVPSVYANIIVQLLPIVNVPVYFLLFAVGSFPSVVYTVVNPFDIGNVTVTSSFVHPVGLIIALPISVIVPVLILIALDTATFPALSVARVAILYSLF